MQEHEGKSVTVPQTRSLRDRLLNPEYDVFDIAGKGIYTDTVKGSLIDGAITTLLGSSFLIAGASGIASLSGGLGGIGVFKALEARRGSVLPEIDHPGGYKTTEMIYRGKHPLPSSFREVLKKGDKFLQVQLPHPSVDFSGYENEQEAYDDLGKFISLKDKYVSSILKEVHNHWPENCSALAINSLDLYIYGISRNNAVLDTRILSGKGIVLEKGYDAYSLLKKSELDKLLEEPPHIVSEAISKLGDPTALALWNAAADAEIPEDQARAFVLLEEQLRKVLKRELDIHFNGPSTTLSRGVNYGPVRNKTYGTIQLKTTDGAHTQYASINDGNGTVVDRQISKLLGVDELTFEDVWASESPLRQAQLAYLLRDSLLRTPHEELLPQKLLSPEEYKRQIEELPFVKEVPKIPSSGEKIDKKKTWQKQLTNWRWRGANALAGLLTATAISSAINREVTIPHPVGIEKLDPRQLLSADEKKGAIDFLTERPKHSVDWEITATMDSAGYYIQSTSHKFEDGSWKPVTQRAEELAVSEEHNDEHTEYIRLGSRIKIDPHQSSKSFKLPMQSTTQLESLRITDPSGDKADYKVYKLTDGTIEVVIDRALYDNDTWFDVSYYLTRAETPQIKATQKVAPLDEKKLDSKLQEAIEKVRQQAQTGDEFTQEIADFVINSHRYSITSPYRNALAQAKTPEEKTNVIGQSDESICNTSNSQLIWMNSLNPFQDSFTNIAVGYMSGVQNFDASNQTQYLLGETSHMFGISEDGNIVDATAKTPADNQSTTEYLQGLGTPVDLSSEWKNQLDDIERDAQIEKAVKIGMATALGAAASYFTLRHGLGVVRNRRREVELDDPVFDREEASFRPPPRIIDEVIPAVDNPLNMFSQADLEKAYEFFTRLSWGREGHKVNVAHASKQDLERKLLNQLNFERLDEYIVDPHKFDSGLTEEEQAKLRMIAGYLMV